MFILTEGVAAGIAAMVSKSDAKGDPATGDPNRPFPNIYGDGFVNKIVAGGINSLVMTAGYHAFGGKGFENDMYKTFNWQNMTYSPFDLGAMVGNAFAEYVQNYGREADAKDRQAGVQGGRELRGYDSDDIGDSVMRFLAATMNYSKSGEQAMKGAFNDLGEIAGTWLKGMGSLALEGIEALGNGVASLWNGAKNALAAMWDGVFGGRPQGINISAKNDPEWQKMIQDKTTVKWILDMYYRDEGFMNMVDDLGLDPELKKVAKDMNRLDALYSMVDKSSLGDGKKLANSLTHEETIELVNTKDRLSKTYGEGYSVTDTEKSALFHALWQGINDGPIMNEIKELLSGNKDFAKSLDGEKYSGKKYTFNMNDPASITNYAKYVAENACLLASLMGAMVLTGSEKAPHSFGEFYKEARESGLIGKLEPNVSYQQIFNHFLGKDVVKVEQLTGESSYAKMGNAYTYSKMNDSTLGGFFFNGNRHWMFFDENIKIYDTGRPNQNGPRQHAWKMNKWIDAEDESNKIDVLYMLILKNSKKLYE